MNVAAIALENLITPISLLGKLKYSSNSAAKEIDEIKERVIDDSFELLKNDIGDELFNQLSFQDKIFMFSTAGSIDYGKAIDLDKIAEEIKKYEF
ncbi:MAG: hypothetical protein V1688_03490 [bacterium]